MNQLMAQISQALEPHIAELRNTATYLHQNPEVGFEEHLAAKHLRGVISEKGFSMSDNPAGMATSFMGSLDSGQPGPHLALLAEYDALPGLGHGCGHNLIATAALGASLALKDLVAELGGRVSLIGTPAEECLGNSGKIQMIAQGVFDEIDAALMVHPCTHTSLADPFLAINDIPFGFKGKAAHAAAGPHLGVNAYDAVQLSFTGINYLRQQMRQDARVHWGEVKVSGAVNIIPDSASAVIGVRSLDNEYTDELCAKVVNCIKGAALMTGCEAEYEVKTGYRSLKSNRVLEGVFGQGLEMLGIPVQGPPANGGAGSTDMGDVSQVVPGIHPMFQIAQDMALHSEEFSEVAGSEAAFERTLDMARCLAFTVAQCLQDPGLVQQAKEEFDQG